MTITIDDYNSKISHSYYYTEEGTKKLTQEEWDQLYADLHAMQEGLKEVKNPLFTPEYNLEAILIARGYSRVIEGIDFSKQVFLNRFDFKNLHFKNCNFYR
jgi:hypothetical protein